MPNTCPSPPYFYRSSGIVLTMLDSHYPSLGGIGKNIYLHYRKYSVNSLRMPVRTFLILELEREREREREGEREREREKEMMT